MLEKLHRELDWTDLADGCGVGEETSRFIKCEGFFD
jgi:hypothetical protein